MQKLNILLIEDNQTIARQLCEFLEGHRWSVDYADNGIFGKELALQHAYDVIILDLNLPDIDGLQVCREIKQQTEINPPILMLTARDSFEDKAKGFGEGADDYVTKPFEFRELALRCQALARRQQLHRNHTLSIGELLIDKKQHLANRQGQSLKCTSSKPFGPRAFIFKRHISSSVQLINWLVAYRSASVVSWTRCFV